MNRFRISMLEMFMLVALPGILVPFLVHVHRQVATRETVWAIELSPDRKLLGRGSDLGVAVFDLHSQRLVTRFGVPAGSLAFSPDSRLIAAGGIDGSVTIWDLPAGKLYRRLQGHTDWVQSVAFSPDSARLYSASRDKTVKAWQVSNGDLAATFQSRAGGIESMTLSPDGQVLAAGATASNSASHSIELWDTNTGNATTVLTGPEYCHVYTLTFGADNKTLAVGLSVPMVRLWDVTNATIRVALPDADGRDLVALSPSGALLVTSYYGGVLVWDTATTTKKADLAGHSGGVLCAVFSPDESTLTTAGVDGTVRTWDLASAQQAHRMSALTMRPRLIPWPILAGFGGWLAVWCLLAYRARGGEVPDAAHQDTKGFILVALGAIYFVANGMSILWLEQNPTSGPDPISALFRLSLLSLAVLMGIGLTLAWRAIRRRLVLWAFSVAMIITVLCYNLHLLAGTIASV